MMQYGLKHTSETNNYFGNSHLKSNINKNTFYNIPNKIKIFCNQNNVRLKYFANISFGIFKAQLDRQKIEYSRK